MALLHGMLVLVHGKLVQAPCRLELVHMLVLGHDNLAVGWEHGKQELVLVHKLGLHSWCRKV